jgi:hypothetical protein
MDLESKYCYFYHSWDFVPYEELLLVVLDVGGTYKTSNFSVGEY